MKSRAIGSMTPTRFRLLLIVIMILTISLSIGGFIFARIQLSNYAKEVSQVVKDAGSSEDSLKNLNLLESELERLRIVNQRATSIVAESQSYQYQNQIITDLNDYASRSGISISQFNFGAGAAEAPAAPPTPGTPGGAPAPPLAAGIKSTTVNISLNTPIDYRSLLTFLSLIEQNLTKMQVSSVSLNKGESASTVTTDSLTIEVYIQ